MPSQPPTQPFAFSLPFPHNRSLRTPTPLPPGPMLSTRNVDRAAKNHKPPPNTGPSRISIWREEVSESVYGDSPNGSMHSHSVAASIHSPISPTGPVSFAPPPIETETQKRRTSIFRKFFKVKSAKEEGSMDGPGGNGGMGEFMRTRMFEGSKDQSRAPLRQEETGSSMWFGSEVSETPAERRKRERLERADALLKAQREKEAAEMKREEEGRSLEEGKQSEETKVGERKSLEEGKEGVKEKGEGQTQEGEMQTEVGNG